MGIMIDSSSTYSELTLRDPDVLRHAIRVLEDLRDSMHDATARISIVKNLLDRGRSLLVQRRVPDGHTRLDSIDSARNHLYFIRLMGRADARRQLERAAVQVEHAIVDTPSK